MVQGALRSSYTSRSHHSKVTSQLNDLQPWEGGYERQCRMEACLQSLLFHTAQVHSSLLVWPKQVHILHSFSSIYVRTDYPEILLKCQFWYMDLEWGLRVHISTSWCCLPHLEQGPLTTVKNSTQNLEFRASVNLGDKKYTSLFLLTSNLSLPVPWEYVFQRGAQRVKSDREI